MEVTGREDEPAPRVLSPLERVSEVLFGLIMALTFTGSLSVATADRTEVRSMLLGALGCNVAWGMIDGVMYLMAVAAERGRAIRLRRELQATKDDQAARRLIAGALPETVASVITPAELDVLRSRLLALPIPRPRLLLSTGDLKGALAVFLLVFFSTLPVALPFVFIKEPHPALRVSNGIALVMLFAGGWQLGRYSGRSPLRLGVIMLAVGVVLVLATIALGG